MPETGIPFYFVVLQYLPQQDPGLSSLAQLQPPTSYTPRILSFVFLISYLKKFFLSFLQLILQLTDQSTPKKRADKPYFPPLLKKWPFHFLQYADQKEIGAMSITAARFDLSTSVIHTFIIIPRKTMNNPLSHPRQCIFKYIFHN